MALPSWAVPTRDLTLSGVITRRTGQQITLTQSDISSYSINDSCSSQGLNIGGVCSATFNLSIHNPNRAYTPQMFDGAEVHMRIKLNSGTWQDFGVWYVDSSDASEQSVLINLSGADALKTRFNAVYQDVKSHYPTTMGNLVQTMATAAGIQLAGTSFTNAAVAISSIPKWPEEVTLRKIVGYVAAVAGGFARINRSGKLEIVPFTGGIAWELGTSLYKSFSLSGGQAFSFNCLQVKLGTDDEFTRFAVDASQEDNATNCLQIEGNPLFTRTIAQSVATELKTLPTLAAASVSWGGDPAVTCGQQLVITDLKGNTHRLLILSQSFTFNGGLSVDERCTLPSVTESSDSFSTVGSTFDADGNVKATHISGLDTSVVNATNAHFENLTAETVKADTLLASIIEAIKLKAQQISATDISTDSLTAMTAEIVAATIRKIQAGTITTDILYAALAEINAAKIESLTAGSITTDRLAAAIAQFGVITAGSADFDRETVKHLIANALNVQDAVGDKVYIKNLMLDYASAVNAWVGNLCVKAADGNFYKLNVNSDGTVSAERTTVTAAEEVIGQKTTGEPIIETSMTVSDLSASNLKAVYALINKLDAERIDVGRLTAKTAFIDFLRTADLASNRAIQIALGTIDEVTGDLSEMRRYLTFADDGLTQRLPGSEYYTRITNAGHDVMYTKQASPIVSINADNGLETSRITMGDIVCKRTSSGGWVWQ